MSETQTRAPGRPTDKMLEFAKNIARRVNKELTQDIMQDFDACRTFIDENKAAASRPTEKQLAFAMRISQERGVELPDDVLADSRAISRWIDDNKG